MGLTTASIEQTGFTTDPQGLLSQSSIICIPKSSNSDRRKTRPVWMPNCLTLRQGTNSVDNLSPETYISQPQNSKLNCMDLTKVATSSFRRLTLAPCFQAQLWKPPLPASGLVSGQEHLVEKHEEPSLNSKTHIRSLYVVMWSYTNF